MCANCAIILDELLLLQRLCVELMKTTIILSVFVFSNEATFHTSGVVNRHNVRIWGSENPHVLFQNDQGSPKVNVWCVLMHNKVTGPFFFNEPTISANVYLDM